MLYLAMLESRRSLLNFLITLIWSYNINHSESTYKKLFTKLFKAFTPLFLIPITFFSESSSLAFLIISIEYVFTHLNIIHDHF